MLADRPLESSWLAARSQFDELRSFVALSSASVPQGDLPFRQSLYCSWVLLTYAAMQGAITSQGSACVVILGRAAQKPVDLPEHLRKEHQRQTLMALADYASGRANSSLTDPQFAAALSSLEQDDWSEHTRLLALDRNVWPDVVRAWLGRLGSSHKLGWIDAPYGGGSETLGSQLERLIDERNRFAHGERPGSLLEPNIMGEWIDAAQFFVERVVRTVQDWTIRTFPDLPYPNVGVVDATTSATLGDQTLAFANVSTSLRIDEVVCVWHEGKPALTKVVSMQSDGVPLEAVADGQERLAVSFARKVAAGSRIHCVP
jgi:hypothetical protein